MNETFWKWRGTAGHFIGARGCCFHLCTDIGGFRISTVGCYHPENDRDGMPHNIGSDRLYETMVFAICGDEVVAWSEIDAAGYSDQDEAEAGHMTMCRKWANAPAWTGPQPVADTTNT